MIGVECRRAAKARAWHAHGGRRGSATSTGEGACVAGDAGADEDDEAICPECCPRHREGDHHVVGEVINTAVGAAGVLAARSGDGCVPPLRVAASSRSAPRAPRAPNERRRRRGRWVVRPSSTCERARAFQSPVPRSRCCRFRALSASCRCRCRARRCRAGRRARWIVTRGRTRSCACCRCTSRRARGIVARGTRASWTACGACARDGTLCGTHDAR
jgi:hypothetical protein